MEFIKKNGKSLKLNSNALTLLFYKKEFKTDFFADLLKLSKSTSVFGSMKQSEIEATAEEQQKNMLEHVNYDDLENLDLLLVYQIFWAMAKTANKNTKPFCEFMEIYSDFLLVDILPAINRLIEKSFRTKKKQTFQKMPQQKS